MLYTNYEHKLPNKEKFREDGLLEALCQVLSEDRDKEKGEIVGSLKKENNGLKKKKGFKEVLFSHVRRNLLSLQENFGRVCIIFFRGEKVLS